MDKSAETCGACHLNVYDEWKTSAHGQLNTTCASCHNPHSQQQMTVDGNKTACETCHKDHSKEVQHSTHQAAGLMCNDCHKNTDQNSGHTFMIGSDTCLKCHADGIHSTDLMVEAGVDVGQEDAGEAAPEEEPAPAAEETAGGAGIALPGWLLILVSVVLGGGLHWLLSTRRLSDLPVKSDAEDEEGK